MIKQSLAVFVIPFSSELHLDSVNCRCKIEVTPLSLFRRWRLDGKCISLEQILDLPQRTASVMSEELNDVGTELPVST